MPRQRTVEVYIKVLYWQARFKPGNQAEQANKSEKVQAGELQSTKQADQVNMNRVLESWGDETVWQVTVDMGQYMRRVADKLKGCR